ncbi:transcription-repair coupling factor [Pseudomonas luteola]
MSLKLVQQSFGSSRSLAVSSLGDGAKTRLVVMPNHCDLEDAASELAFFTGFSKSNILVFPDLETLPYDLESPSEYIVSKRAAVFHALIKASGPFVVVTNVNALMMYVSGPSHWIDTQLSISVGQSVNSEELSSALLDLGYKSGPIVNWPGSFCIHPNVIDIFPIGPSPAVRLRLKNRLIESIAVLDVRSQRSHDEVQSILCMPALEVPSSSESVAVFRKQWRELFESGFGNPVYDAVTNKQYPAGIEYYTSLFSEQKVTIFDYLPTDFQFFVVDGAYEEIERHWKAINRRYDDLLLDTSRSVLRPELVWVKPNELIQKLDACDSFYIGDVALEQSDIDFQCFPHGIVRQDTTKQTVALLAEWKSKAKAIVVVLSTDAKAEQVKLLALMAGMPFHTIQNWEDFGAATAQSKKTVLCMCVGPLESGFYNDANGLVLVTEKELFGQSSAEKTTDTVADEELDINDFLNIKHGDRLVHLKYGIGEFQGTQSLDTGGVSREYFKIGYADHANAFVRMEDLDQVSRFGAIEDRDRPLDVMGTEQWLSDLSNATASIGHTASILLNIQKERSLRRGLVIKKPSSRYNQFSNEFPFNETPDQKKAIKDIEQDLMSERPMDRVLIGDVGFGKTEVAARAAFLAADSGYQVVLLVPTTLLAQQHYENLKQRFSSFPDIVVDCMSRNTDDEKRVLRDLESGKTRFVIGTHRLLQGDVQYENLGLIIIDEEHRFGVHQKEALRSMRTNINLLSMSATPIPRTLSMSLMGVRDVSVLNTPPAKRLSIRTYVTEYSEARICEYIDREVQRSGQVFFLHNSIGTIAKRTEELQALMPDVRFEFAHGKMDARQLEQIMVRFNAKKFDVLVSTTIVEIGIDIPNANTMIIERADMMGIAQLHQLRGRVGRSSRQAYCYLLTPSDEQISETATKRLDAMVKASNLGEGSILANHDLEIRGAGEILGEEQSGHIQTIGYPLYLRLLERAVELLNQGRVVTQDSLIGDKIQLEVNLTGLIPETYIKNLSVRVSIYKRIASITNGKQLGMLIDELNDRFGDFPEETANLLIAAQYRLHMRHIGINQLHIDSEGGRVEVSETAVITPHDLIDFCEKNPEKAKMIGPWSIRFYRQTQTREDRINAVWDIIDTLLNFERLRDPAGEAA